MFDSDGHETEHHWAFTTSGRLIAPSFTFTEPLAGSVFPPGPVRLTARFSAGSDPTGLAVMLDGQPIPSTAARAQAPSDTAGVHVWTIMATSDIDPGGHQIEVRATTGRDTITAATLDLAASQDESRVTARYFLDRGLFVTGPFLKYWLQGGHDKIFGQPVYPQFVASDGVTTQYFDTERLELNKDGTVSLGLLGKAVLKTPQ